VNSPELGIRNFENIAKAGKAAYSRDREGKKRRREKEKKRKKRRKETYV
jgi:rRNA processing protein Gar1